MDKTLVAPIQLPSILAILTIMFMVISEPIIIAYQRAKSMLRIMGGPGGYTLGGYLAVGLITIVLSAFGVVGILYFVGFFQGNNPYGPVGMLGIVVGLVAMVAIVIFVGWVAVFASTRVKKAVS